MYGWLGLRGYVYCVSGGCTAAFALSNGPVDDALHFASLWIMRRRVGTNSVTLRRLYWEDA